MPWIYTLQLTEFRVAGKIKHDWENNIPGNAKVEDGYGGVSVHGARCVIVSQRNNPEYEEMESFDYVQSITEHKEIPETAEQADLGLGFSVDRR